MTPPFLTDEEIGNICQGLTLPSAQCRYMEKQLGLLVRRKPNGHALVARSEFERVLGAGRFEKAQNDVNTGPNVVAMVNRINSRRNGQTTKGR